MMIKDKFKGKVAIVTGAGTGIGKAIASGFAHEGANVVIADMNRELGESVVTSLKSEGLDAAFVPGDVGKSEDCTKIVQFAVDTYSKIDILVNNAGINLYGSLEELSLEDWNRTVNVNLNGPFMLMKTAIPYMRKNGGGSIINIASLAALRSLPRSPGYCATKAALINLTKQVAYDYGQHNIRCNVICPGLFITDMVKEAFSRSAKEVGTDFETFMTVAFQDIPVRKPAYPEQIYGTVSFLASEDSSYTTGAEILVDGGTAVGDPFTVCVSKAEAELKQQR